MIEALYKLLAVNAAVTALVETRIHYSEKPQGETGASIVIQRGAENRQHTFDGAAGYVQGFARLNVFSPTYLGIEPIKEAIRQALDGFQGEVEIGEPDAPVALVIDYVKFDDDDDIPVTNLDGKALPPFYGRWIDVRFQFQESIPTFG